VVVLAAAGAGALDGLEEPEVSDDDEDEEDDEEDAGFAAARESLR